MTDQNNQSRPAKLFGSLKTWFARKGHDGSRDDEPRSGLRDDQSENDASAHGLRDGQSGNGASAHGLRDGQSGNGASAHGLQSGQSGNGASAHGLQGGQSGNGASAHGLREGNGSESRDVEKRASGGWSERRASGEVAVSPFRALIRKEVSDHVRSWRFIVLLAIIALTCLGSLYAALGQIKDAISQDDAAGAFVFLKLFTISDGTVPTFIKFVSFLGPLLGIGLGFDAVNSERNKGTLSRIMSQPIYRDSLLNAKFIGALIVIAIMFLSLGLVTMGLGILIIGIPPTPEEFLRMLCFIIAAIIYVGFWLNLSMIFSVRFRQPATSALSGIGIWLFFSIFYNMLVELIARAIAPSETSATVSQIINFQENVLLLNRLSPSNLFEEMTTTLMMPTVRSLGPLTSDQVYGAIPGPLPFSQSLLLVWPQMVGMIAATLICFAISYVMFMRQEIRAR